MSHFTKNPNTVIPIPPEKVKYMNTRKIESESGAKIRIKKGERPLAIINGDKKQCEAAKTLIKAFIEKSLVIPTIGYTLLEVDSIADVNKAKFQFIKFEGVDIDVFSKNKEHYSVQLMKETKDDSEFDLADSFDQKLEISPSGGGFTTSEKLDSCLNDIYSQLSKADPTDSERREVRLNLFFGRELFSNVDKQYFDVSEWIKFRRWGKKYCTSFQQSAPQILEKMSLLEKGFNFKEDKRSEITSKNKDKGSIAIYFDQDSSRRKLKLHWNEEGCSWKITKCVRSINRMAILDLISGNEAPDCRFLLKTCYDLKVGSKLTKVIDEIQNNRSFKMRDEMWFRVEDFDGKLDKVEVRQTMSKRRFFNGSFQISIATIKQDSNGKLITQQTTSLKNKRWRSVENIDQNLSLHYDEQEISNTICETINLARDIVKVLS
ncbi:unnamed protein product [Rhizophagus irregularis]|uniref:K Homology domain-containing protein n=1 Tax=Rhizophagus irregularis TaxID=588596 RepID=A0A2I1H727_9GLOM|nr:hypothetical protein RhiirA4_410002 [Rhizophagus irregularis]CAB4420832.1 unnamed protein product [Rhizophagus irregularis]CAB4421554.1 unnamed protein product [Rhizophagus irregularis]